MKDEQIKMNEVIARFMGMKPVYSGVEISGWEDETGRMIILGSYKPNEDWNELMPVVEKISKILALGEKIKVPPNEYELDAFAILRRPIYSVIETIHNDVYQFIIWYNKQNSNHDT